MIGFLDDPRRLNVAITRPRYGLWVVGHRSTLQTSTHWRAFIEHADAAGAITTVGDDPATSSVLRGLICD